MSREIKYVKTPIRNIGDVITGRTPLTAVPEYYGNEYMFITPEELHGEYCVIDSGKKITQAGLDSIKSSVISGLSVMVGCIGWDMGNVAICKEQCATNQQINSITNFKEGFNPYYVYYWLTQQKKYLFSIASVTRTPILSKSAFEEVEIPVPDKEEQDKVVNVLLPIDRKIANNNRISETLISAAFSTYLYMFYKRGTNGVLGDLIVEKAKSTIQVGDAKDAKGAYPFFTSGASVLEWDDFVSDGRNCYLNTGGVADVKYYSGKAAYSTDTWCISSKNGYEDYLYLILYSIKPELDKKFFQGTGLKHLQKPLLKKREIYIPSKPEMEIFNACVSPMFDRLSLIERENRKLIDLKAMLVPVLLNGQAVID